MSKTALAATLCAAAVVAGGAVMAQATQEPAAELQASTWVMTHVDKNTPVPGALTGKITLQFKPFSADYPVPTLFGFGGCNSYTAGVFDIAKDQLSGISTPLTEPAPQPCSAEATSAQDAYFNVLGNNPLYYIEGDNLTLIDGDITVLRFVRKA